MGRYPSLKPFSLLSSCVGILPSTHSVLRCPNCQFKLEKAPHNSQGRRFTYPQNTEAHLYYNCLTEIPPFLPTPRQPLFCHCGEADSEFDTYWRSMCDFNLDGKGNLPTSWFRKSFALGKWNISTVTDFAHHILLPPPLRDPARVAVFIQSNCHTRSGREHIVWGLQRVGAVDSLGFCLNNSGIPFGIFLSLIFR